MAHIFVTRRIPESGIDLLRAKGHTVTVSSKEGVLTKQELISELKNNPYDAVLCLLTDKIDGDVMSAAPSVKIFANYAVGFDNLDRAAAKDRGVLLSNTPGVLTEAVAEHAIALMMAAARRVPESDQFMRAGKYGGWDPLLLMGTELKGKTLGIVGLGRIGSRVAEIAMRGFGMSVFYYDVKRNEQFEKDLGASYSSHAEEVLRAADVISIHVPLLPETKHLVNADRLALMKKTAIVINTSRGPIVDEAALVVALKNKTIAAAGLDVFENEPALAPGLAELPNVVLTPHTASATIEAREAMSKLAAENILAALEGTALPSKLE